MNHQRVNLLPNIHFYPRFYVINKANDKDDNRSDNKYELEDPQE